MPQTGSPICAYVSPVSHSCLAFDIAYGVALKLAISPDIEEPARCVIGPSAKGITIGEELDGVDIGVVSSERLTALLLPNIPQLRKCVTSARHELIVVERIDAQAHDIAQVIGEFGDLLASLDIPKHTGHVT